MTPFSYGPQGVYIIDSCLQRLLAENEDDHDLDYALFSTMLDIVENEEDHFSDGVYDDDCYLKLKIFTEFILVPFVACSLIVQDFPSLDLRGAIFERNSSHEYGGQDAYIRRRCENSATTNGNLTKTRLFPAQSWAIQQASKVVQ